MTNSSVRCGLPYFLIVLLNYYSHIGAHQNHFANELIVVPHIITLLLMILFGKITYFWLFHTSITQVSQILRIISIKGYPEQHGLLKRIEQNKK